jgi:AraC family transcriptional regulator of adaptative response/methylated-DNA-[protein]-cysteine methyltransferase
MTDYDRIAKAIDFIARRVDSQPTLEEIAGHLHLSPFHFQRLFCRWAGVTPKRFLQVLTVQRAKALLREAMPLLAVSDALGLSSGSRLYDHFVQLEAVTPGEFRARGAGLVIRFAVHETPFGPAFVAMTPRGICHFAFVDGAGIDGEFSALRAQWPLAELREDGRDSQAVIAAMFAPPGERATRLPISLHVSGTNFQVSVWKALLNIAPATVASYTQVAEAVGRPKAARAVGQAVGANPVALLIPCHRVIRESGELGGYHWGNTRKLAIQAWEQARA